MTVLNADMVKVDDNEYDNNGTWTVKMQVLYLQEATPNGAELVQVHISGRDEYGHKESTARSRTIQPAVKPKVGWIKLKDFAIAWAPDLQGRARMETWAELLTANGEVIPGSQSAILKTVAAFR